MVGETFLGESQLDHIHGLVELPAVGLVGGRLIRVVKTPDSGTQRLGLPWDGAPPDAEDPPTSGEVMQSGEVLGQAERMPLRDDVESHPDPDSLGALSDDRTQEDAVGNHFVALVLEVVLGKPVRVVAQVVTDHGHVDDPLRGLPRFLAGGPAVGGGRRAGTGVVHLHPAKKEHTGTHQATLGKSQLPGRSHRSLWFPTTRSRPNQIGQSATPWPGDV